MMKTIDEFLAHLYRLEVNLWLEGDRLRCSAPEEVLTPDLTEALQSRKGEIINFLKQVNLTVNTDLEPIKPINRDQPLPLSFAQQRLWFLEQLQPGSFTYHIPTAVRLTGSLNIPVLEQSFNEIIRRHETLRTHFTMVEGEPVQVIDATLTLSLPILSLESLDEREQEAEVFRLASQEAQKPFDLAQDPLLRVTLLRLNPADHVVLLTLHHIIADGWSMDILIRELTCLYEGFLKGESSPLPPLPIQYGDFAAWQRQRLQGEKLAQQLAYWKEQLQGSLSVLQLPTDFLRSRIQGFRGGNETFTLSPRLTDKLKALSQQEGATLFMTLLAAFKVLLYRYTGQEDIIVGSPIANRNRSEIEGLIGFFVNTLVLRTNVAGNPSFQSLLNQVRGVTWGAYDHQDLPFEKLVEELHPERDLSYNPLFQVKFRLENAPTESYSLPDLTLRSLKQAYSTAKLDLSLDMYETATGLVGGFEYNRDLFTPETINRMVGHFCTLLESIVDDPTQPISELSLLSEEEEQTILYDWNNTQIDYAENCCFHQLFEEQVAKNPDAVALIFESQSLTYQELNQQSNQLAHYLQTLGVKPEVKVGICVERSPEMIIALLAIFKAGGAYVPLDPAYPQERLAFMVSDSQISVLLTTETLAPTIPQAQAQVICLDRDWKTIRQKSQDNPIGGVTPQNLAYLIYTSGSTGTPKGVLVSHGGLVNLTEDKIRVCQVSPDSCVLQFFSFSFDASIPEIIMALGCGAKLCLAKLESLLPGPNLLKLLKDEKITHITITPSALSNLAVTDLPDLEMVLVGGEAPSPELIDNWSGDRLFINAYGPTEVTVNASMVPCGNGHPTLPTLLPSANKQLYILDRHLQPVPVGVLGELHIGGVGLARGYLNRPDLTAERFIPSPFDPPLPLLRKGGKKQGARLYKTGDLACYLPDGRIKLLGRLDNQLKIRGFRLETGEIETLLQQHPQIKATVVIGREEVSGDKRLVAYYVAEPTVPSASELRQFLREKLPEYAIPSAFVSLEAFPLTPNGKIDIKSLPAPEQSRSTGDWYAPRTETEKAVAQVFSQVLEVEKVSINDDFFDLGGHSLLATRLIAQLLEIFPVDITIIDLFEAPTIMGLAERIEGKQMRDRLQTVEEEVTEEREEIEI
ncbi:peptide synthetase [Crocosphaera subtropica ATCC 51142]|uniref:Peptide synthetase n=1 Tax=Crocosphaera subtropica (strain ATCC 51142 / BH68) TaxID=43989 RepID=B1WWS1_CROS5|nr:non-ribosomal peptide synthetase [Crocosphaera subtropica]ACB52390.1 peptide synthetase [Crocosphaera subtropica ATCC 51142]